MQLTSERENKLVTQNKERIEKFAKRFYTSCRTRSPLIDLDDMIQQANIAYLMYIRGCETEEELEIFPVQSLKHWMTEYVLANQIIRVPTSTKQYRESMYILRNFDYAVCTPFPENDLDGMSPTWVKQCNSKMDLNMFKELCDDVDRQLIELLPRKMTARELAQECGIPKSTAHDRLKRLGKNYLKWNNGGDIDD